MTDLLPIIFTRGQNEGIDPRVAPPDVHALARNVRWRKDGRPAKRYGVTAVTTAGLAAPIAYNTQPVNAITSWNRTPVLAIGSTVRQLGPNGWIDPPAENALGRRADELPKWGPGEHDIIARDEAFPISNATSGYCKGMTLHVWEGGAGLYHAVKGRDGSTIVSPRVVVDPFVLGARYPRCVSTADFIFVITKTSAGALQIHRFDPVSLQLAFNVASAGTLASPASFFDAVGRDVDFIVTYQSGATDLTTKLFSAVAVPVLLQNQTALGAIAANCLFGVTSAPGALIYVVVQEPAGSVKCAVYNTTLTAGSGGGGLIETDPNNNAQPGIVIVSATKAHVVWGGFVTATATSYMRATEVSGTTASIAAPATYYGVSPASKPFVGPAFATLPNTDGAYVWVATPNATNNSTKWDSQRAYYLMRYQAGGNQAWLTRQMHVPGVAPNADGYLHLLDVLPLGGGFGYLTPLLNAIRFGKGLTPALGFDAVTFHSIFGSLREAARDTSTAGRVLQFSGGSLMELNGEAEETEFSNFPVIQSIAAAGGGGLSAGSYLYRAVYEWIDDQGRRHRSAASDPVQFTAAASSAAAIVMKPLIACTRTSGSAAYVPSGVTLHVYRSLVGQSTLHRVTPNIGAPPGFVPGVATVSFTDTLPDTVAGAQEFLYTEGGVADNTLCPPHQFQTVCNARLWVAGQLDRCVITASKILVDGEPTQFSDLEQFSVFLPEECTGIASIDGTVVAFAREKIYFVNGDGPNDQGVGLFNPPTELPTDDGCIDWRSVAETSIGVFFQGRRGIFLLPRGFNTPQFIGADVESTLATYPIITSATVVTMPSNGTNSLGEVTVRFVVATDENATSTSVLVFDLRTGGWSVDELAAGPKVGGSWLDSFITARVFSGAVQLHAENASSGYLGATTAFMRTALGTGDIRPFGVAGYGGFETVVLVGEFRGTCDVNVEVSVDGKVSDTFVFSVTGPDGDADGSVYLDVTPRIRLGSSIRVTCSDFNDSVSEGFIMQALFIEHETIGKTKRLAAARRA